MRRTEMKRLVLAVLVLACLAALVPAAARETVQPQVVKQDLRSILSAPEYNRTYERAQGGALDQIMRAIGRAIGWVFEQLGKGLGAVDKPVSILLGGLVIAAFVVLVFLVLNKVLRQIGRDEPDDGSDAEDFQLLSATPLIKEAAKRAQAGDFRGAFKCAYLASISHLDEAKALRFERSRTNWEYMRELKSGGHEQPYETPRPLTMDFDRKFYGGEPCTLADYERAAQAYDRIAGKAAA